MIAIEGMNFSEDTLINEYEANSIERKILDKLSSSDRKLKYNSIEELKFELALRKDITAAARNLNKSDMIFRTFRKSMCNEQYWVRMSNGGFMLKEGVKPSDAINDIFVNGHKYGTECATAIVIIFYKALLDLFGNNAFDVLFPNIELMDWQNVDDKFDIQFYRNLKDDFPGDCRYFQNPDVDPLKPWWQGENVIVLEDGTYFGHGVGIRKEKQVIEILNGFRKKAATESAYLTNSSTHPGFEYLSALYVKSTTQ